MPSDTAEYDGQPKEVGVQDPTLRSVADRAELIPLDLPFQRPVLVHRHKTRFVTQPANVHTKDGKGGPIIRITTPEYDDHTLNMRLLNYLPRDKALMQLSAVTVTCLKTLGWIDELLKNGGISERDRIAGLVASYGEFQKLYQAITEYLDAQEGTLDMNAEEEADPYGAVLEKLDMIEDNLHVLWEEIKSDEAAVRKAGFSL